MKTNETKQILAEIANYFGLDYLVILRNSDELQNALDDIIELRREPMPDVFSSAHISAHWAKTVQ